MLFSPVILSNVKLSTVHRGTAFEQRSLKILQDHLSMSLRRVGGKADGGVDLVGWWWLPSSNCTPASNTKKNRRRIRVIAQCKAEKRKSGPNYVRELEGVAQRYISKPTTAAEWPPSQRDLPLVALLISESPFTKATVLRSQSSSLPLFLLHIPPLTHGKEAPLTAQDNDDDDERDCEQLVRAFWNPALGGARGLLGDTMELRWEWCKDLGGCRRSGRPALWFRGTKVENWTPDAVDNPGEQEDWLVKKPY